MKNTIFEPDKIGLQVSCYVDTKTPTDYRIFDPYFNRNVLTVLQKIDLPPQLLEVEITESTILKTDAVTIAMFRQLRQARVRIAIDDFGMGHTSLRYVLEFPVDTFKIDRPLTLVCQGREKWTLSFEQGFVFSKWHLCLF